MPKPHVVIIGAGFAGLNAAKRLTGAPVRITLIDQHNYHLFQPLLYQVAIAGLLPAQIAYPLRAIFRHQENLSFQMDEVTGVDFARRFIRMKGSAIAYDYLVLAVGGQTNFFGLDSVEANAQELKDIHSAVATRNHLLALFEQASQENDEEDRRGMLTFVVVGGGPTGVETAGALAELINRVMVKDFPELNLREARVLLLEMTGQLISAYPPNLQVETQRLLEGKGVEICLNTRVLHYNGEFIELGDGSRIHAKTLIWTGGVRAARLLDKIGIEQAHQGRVPVLRTLQLAQNPEVFVVGDAAYLTDDDGQPLPMLSTVAIQQGRHAAGNIRRALEGKAMQPFHYKDPGLLATIGRNAAVARIWGVSFSGFVAWMIWVGLHIMRLVGFRNRLLVLVNWAWDYFFYENQVRLITRE